MANRREKRDLGRFNFFMIGVFEKSGKVEERRGKSLEMQKGMVNSGVSVSVCLSVSLSLSDFLSWSFGLW
jgi:hypothetical protein